MGLAVRDDTSQTRVTKAIGRIKELAGSRGCGLTSRMGV